MNEVKNRVRVSDEIVSVALREANGSMTLKQLANKLGMKENTLRAQVNRIEKKVMSQAPEGFKFPSIKDGRTSVDSNARELFNIFSSN